MLKSTENWNSIFSRLNTAEDRIIYLIIKTEEIIDCHTERKWDAKHKDELRDMKYGLWWFSIHLFRD